MQTVNVLRDYQFNGGARRRYGILYRAGTVYENVREPIAAELEREGAGTIVGMSRLEQRGKHERETDE